MIYGDYHMHTSFCDGRSTPEEMVQSAIDKGLVRMGFSIHAENFSSGTSIPRTPENFAAYRAEIHRLKEKYADRIYYATDFHDPRNLETYDAYQNVVDFLEEGRASGKLSEENYRKICRENALKLLGRK